MDKAGSKLTEELNTALQEYTEWNKKCDHLGMENDTNKINDVTKQKLFEQEFIKNTKLQEEKVKIVVDLLKIQEQLLEREQVVFSKDETIKLARDEQINLENFQFMLEQKIKSLNTEKSELDDEINIREKILRDMFNELIKQSQTNSGLFHLIRDRVQKIQILSDQQKNIELKIYYWCARIKDYHRKLTSKIESTSKTSEVKILVNKLLSDSNIERQKNIDETKAVMNLNSSSADVGTNVHKELIEQNTWLIKKINMIELAAKNIRKIREEKIETGMNKNKKLIEECNKLKVDNDKYTRNYDTYKKRIQEVKNQIEAQKNEMIRKKKFEASNNNVGSPSGLLPKLVKQYDADNSTMKNETKSQGLSFKGGIRSHSHSFGVKKIGNR